MLGAPGDESEFMIGSMPASRGMDHGSDVTISPMGFGTPLLPDVAVRAPAELRNH